VGESLETWEARHQRKAAEGINLHRPLPIAVEQEQRKQWATATVSTGAHRQKDGSMTPKLDEQVKQWATPRAGKTTDENPETWALRQAAGEVATMPLMLQVKAWATPRCSMAQDKQEDSGKHRLGEQAQHNTNGKLNPRWVETLMGLPVGWVMPSCKSPVTIEPTNCDSSATESSLPQRNLPSEPCLPS
jgi:hypothetical protein